MAWLKKLTAYLVTWCLVLGGAAARPMPLIPEGPPLAKALKNPSRYKHVTFNCDTTIKREEGYFRAPYAPWCIEHRMAHVLEVLSELAAQNVDFFTIQEGHQFTRPEGAVVDSITPIQKHLQNLGYAVLLQPYRDDDPKAFTYITAWKADLYEFVDQEILYGSKTPNKKTPHPDLTGLSRREKKAAKKRIIKHNFGALWEKGVSFTHLREKTTGTPIFLGNVHLSVKPTARLKATEIINTKAQELAHKYPQAAIIIAGDFNTFKDAKGAKQLRRMDTQGILKRASAPLLLPNGAKSPSSFYPAPYNFMDKSREFKIFGVLHKLSVAQRRQLINTIFSKFCRGMGAQLDQVLYWGIGFGQSYLVPTPRYADGQAVDYTSEHQVKTYITAHMDQGPAFASDHQPLLTIFH